MAQLVLFQVAPLVPAGTVTYPVRIVAGGNAGQAYGSYLGVDDWRSGAADAPRYTTSIGFDDTGWTGGALPQVSTIEIAPTSRAYFNVLAGLYWNGARILIHKQDQATGVFNVDLVGTVLSASCVGGRITLTIADLSGDLNNPMAGGTFAGNGGLEGGDDAVGRVKRRSWGRVFNVEGRLLDKVNNVYEFGDPARGLQGIPQVFDKGEEATGYVDIAWQGSAAATLTALQNAAVAQGQAARAPSIACVKWWTDPAGPLTAHLFGEAPNGAYADVQYDVLQAILEAAKPATYGVQSIAYRNYIVGIHCDDPNETAANLLDRLLLPLGLVWALTPAGIIRVTEFTFAAGVETFLSHEIERTGYAPPLRSRKLGFQRNQRIHSDAEISAAVLAAGTDATYADGTPIDVLRPAEAGANITETRVSSGFNGQGALATQGNVYFGSPYLLETNGGASATIDAFKTILGTAASIFGQAWAATNGYQNIVDNSFVRASANSIPNSDQTTKVTAYARRNPNGATFGLVDADLAPSYASSTWPTTTYALSGKTRNLVVRQIGRNTSNPGLEAIDYGFYATPGVEHRMTCAPGERIIGSCYTAMHRCSSAVYLIFFDASGNEVLYPVSPNYSATNNAANILSEPYYVRPYIIAVAPSNAVSVALVVRKLDTYAGEADSYMWFAAPMLEKAKANQEGPSPYEPGGVAAVSQAGFLGDLDATNTLRNVAQGIANQGALALINYVRMGGNSGGVGGYAGIYNEAGTAFTTDNGYQTALGQSASFYGQAGLATLSFVQFGASRTVVDQNGNTVTDNLVVTSAGIAAGFYGQGGLSTKDAVGYADLIIDQLRKQDPRFAAGPFQTGNFGQELVVDPVTATISGIYASGDLYIDFNAAVTYLPQSNPDPNDSSMYIRVRYPDGSYSPVYYIPNSGARSLTIPSTQSGTHQAIFYLYRGTTNQPQTADQPRSVSPHIRVSNVSLTLRWKAI